MFLDVGEGYSALIGHASVFHNASELVDNFQISCDKGAVPTPWGRSWAKDGSVTAFRSAGFQRKYKMRDEDSHFYDSSVSATVKKFIQILKGWLQKQDAKLDKKA